MQSGNVTAGIIRKDFVNDYGPALMENGFTRRGSVFNRVHGKDVLLYVRAAFIRSEWTVSFAAYAFTAAYEDMKGYDGIRMSSILRHAYRMQNRPDMPRFDDKSNENYQDLRKECRELFFGTVFPVFNNVTSIETYIDFKNWHSGFEQLVPDHENLALACFMANDYGKGAAYLGQYLQHAGRAYRARIAERPDEFTREYEMYRRFTDDIDGGNTDGVDAYVAGRTAVTEKTCAGLKLTMG